jgi:hypothetical protein
MRGEVLATLIYSPQIQYHRYGYRRNCSGFEGYCFYEKWIWKEMISGSASTAKGRQELE